MSAEEIIFIVPGQTMEAAQGLGRAAGGPRIDGATPGTVRTSVRVSAQRGAGAGVRVAARPGEDLVLLHIANGPILCLHPENAKALMRAQVIQSGPTGRGAGDSAADDVPVPARLAWRDLEPSATRGGAAGQGEAFLDAVEVVTALVTDKATEWTSAAAAKRVDDQVEAGVYRLSPERLSPLKGASTKLDLLPAGDEPILVLAHGTFVETSSTFGKLWEKHPARVQALFKRYAGRVYALDHPTVGASPFVNAATLVETLPAGARVHLVTHSRGGLVGEVLARVAAGQGLRPEDLELFSGDAQSAHRAELERLGALTKERAFRVERLVRVACPARGTLLASRRLDAYLSVLKWGLKLAGVPVAPAIVGFLAEVALRRADPATMPGLEAMMPGSAFTNWLNASTDPVPGELRVVAGDLHGDSVRSWVKTLLSEAFYWTDNDLVVQTRSMYGGASRVAPATFLLDRGGGVSHFNYFSNERTADAITRALLQDRPDEFRTIGPKSFAGQDASGARGIQRGSGAAFERPAVFVLPGILGSHLKVDGERVWLSVRLFNSLKQLSWDEQGASRIQPDGPVGMSYDALIARLTATHEVVPFAYDWRRPLEDEARRLADAIEDSLAARAGSRQPVRIVAHSMGGLLVRVLRLERPETWRRMLERDGARVLMLGTPNDGSWAPMQVLSGDDTFGNMLTAFGSLFDSAGARRIMAGMPGFLQLQAGLLDPALGLDAVERWTELARNDLEAIDARRSSGSWWHDDPLQLDPHTWGVPTPAALGQAVALWKRLDEQRDGLSADAQKIALVVGKAPNTPDGMMMTENGLVYLAGTGDGRVTHRSARLPGVATFSVDAAHGELSNAADAFDGYVELLAGGSTIHLAAFPEAALSGPAARGGMAVAGPVRTLARLSRAPGGSQPPSSQQDVFTQPAGEPVTHEGAGYETGPRLTVTIVHGNLKFVREPLLLGHYGAMELTGSEAEMNRLLGDALSASLNAGLYPLAPGTNQVFINAGSGGDDPFVRPRPEAVIVAGLGEEGTLRLVDLVLTARQATLAYAQRVAAPGAPSTFDLAATLFGSGGIGVTSGAAAQAIVKGVRQANDRIRSAGWPMVAHLRLIELYLDRAVEAHHAVGMLAADCPRRYELTPRVESQAGGLPRPLEPGYRAAGYDFVSVKRRADGADGAILEFTLDTKRARDEVRGQATQIKLVERFVAVAADNRNRRDEIGRSLFKLLTPLELEQFLSQSSGLLLQLDPETAAYPWEALDTGSDDQNDERTPWAVRTGMLRKLRTPSFRDRPADARRGDGALVIGEPKTSKYPPLPAARTEASAVAEILGIEALLGPDPITFVNAVLRKPRRILHIAGHGDLIAAGTGGVVIGDDVFGPREIGRLGVAPELAFINCCFLGRIEPGTDQKESPLDGRRPQFAASVAQALIEIGVKCVIAAGWAVDDEPARVFATTFYRKLMDGATLREAVAAARGSTYSAYPRSNTWAAYQCYGDPDWRHAVDGQSVGPIRPRVLVSPADLTLELQVLGTQIEFDEGRRDVVMGRLEQLEVGYASEWGRNGAVSQAFGAAYGELRDFSRAIHWYQQAIATEDGGASLRASEQLANLRARRGAEMDDLKAGRQEIMAAIELLGRLLAIEATCERASLLGSAYKSLVVLEGKVKGRAKARIKALEAMAGAYARAERIACDSKSDALFYPRINRMVAQLMLKAGGRGAGFDASDLAAARLSLQNKAAANPDFWAIVGLTELRLLEALAAGALAVSVESIMGELTIAKAKANAPRRWDSVRKQTDLVLWPLLNGRATAVTERDAAAKLLQLLEGFASA